MFCMPMIAETNLQFSINPLHYVHESMIQYRKSIVAEGEWMLKIRPIQDWMSKNEKHVMLDI